jgi:hypothetical protein
MESYQLVKINNIKHCYLMLSFVLDYRLPYECFLLCWIIGYHMNAFFFVGLEVVINFAMVL